jgi:hypothetical protein
LILAQSIGSPSIYRIAINLDEVKENGYGFADFDNLPGVHIASLCVLTPTQLDGRRELGTLRGLKLVVNRCARARFARARELSASEAYLDLVL